MAAKPSNAMNQQGSAGLQTWDGTSVSSTIANVATGQVLTSQGTGTLPAFSAYPQVSGLGIGASPGSTAGLTFDGTNFLDNFASGTFTPTIFGHTTAGTTTYTLQTGFYQRIGGMVWICAEVTWTNATGTGTIDMGGLPYTVNSSYNFGFFPASIYSLTILVSGTTYIQPIFQAGTTVCRLFGVNAGTGAQGPSVLASNTSCSLYVNGFYPI